MQNVQAVGVLLFDVELEPDVAGLGVRNPQLSVVYREPCSVP